MCFSEISLAHAITDIAMYRILLPHTAPFQTSAITQHLPFYALHLEEISTWFQLRWSPKLIPTFLLPSKNNASKLFLLAWQRNFLRTLQECTNSFRELQGGQNLLDLERHCLFASILSVSYKNTMCLGKARHAKSDPYLSQSQECWS